MDEKNVINDEELTNVSGGSGSGYCIKSYNNYEATREFCIGCGMATRLKLPVSGGGGYYKCGNGVPGSWSE